MGQVYLYLASWVAGGVLLGAGMLLQQKAAAASANDGEQHSALKRARAWSELAVFGLVGFGLAGMSCEMAAVAEPWPVVCATSSGAAFATLAQALRGR